MKFTRPRPVLLLAAGLISLITAAPLTSGASAQDKPLTQLALQQMEEQLYALVNTERRVQDLKELTLDSDLSDVARQHCAKMAAEKTLNHEFPGYDSLDSRLSAAGLYYNATGNNIVFSRTSVVRFIHQALVASPGHRKNMLNGQFTHIGIGIVQVEDGYYVTQVFARLFKPYPPAEMVRVLEAELHERLSLNGAGPLVFLDWLADVAERSAADVLKGLPAPNLPDSLGKCTLMNISFFDVLDAVGALEKQILNEKTGGISVAVAFGRSEKYPGGVYVASALLLPAGPMFAFEEVEIPQRLFQVINGLRAEQGLEPFILSPKLAGDAQTAARAYYLNPEGPSLSAAHSMVIAFKSDGPHLALPPDVSQKLLSVSGQPQLGIGAYYPLKHQTPGNYIIVAFVVE